MARSYRAIFDRIKELGFNVVRIPFSNQALLSNSYPTKINFGLNYDLQGLNSLQCLDKFIQYSGQIGLRIILDRHSAAAGNFSNEYSVAISPFYTVQRYIDDWVMLAKRYAGTQMNIVYYYFFVLLIALLLLGTSVIGADLWNEPKVTVTWGFNNKTDWNLIAQTVGTAIQQVNPDWLIIIEGIGANYWWGGNLMGVATSPILLPYQNKVIYSVHEYAVDLYPQPWFINASYPGGPFPGNMRNIWDTQWGYIIQQNIAPVYIGEFGTDLMHQPFDDTWLPLFLRYINGEFTTDGVNDLLPGQLGLSWTWWAINPDPQNYSLFEDDWYTVANCRFKYIKPYLGKPLA